MSSENRSAFELTASEIERLIANEATLFPEFHRAGQDLGHLRTTPQTQALLAEADAVLAEVEQIPQTTYSRFHAFSRNGERGPYEAPYFLKRDRLGALVARFLLGEPAWKDHIEDYLWDICEESTWVLPAHARVIDLMAAETALLLAESLYLLGDALDSEVRRRVRREIDDRVFTPFLTSHFDLRWFNGSDNWNGVCSGAIGGAFLYLEEDSQRLARAQALAIESLNTYVATAFEADGGTTEGVGYWQYGLNNVVIFAEMLRARTAGVIDLLADRRFRQIATFPARMLMPNDRFVSFSDCPTEVPLSPGLISRLAERTGESSLLSLLTPTSTIHHEAGGPRGLRNVVWWDGRYREPAPVGESVLPDTGIARLTGTTREGAPIVLIVKAGHNGENHNHNDIGSFVLNVGGEDFLTDPGPGRIDRDYFRDETRYNTIFANSLGHSVPFIGGRPQGTGRRFAGSLRTDVDGASGQQSVVVEFADAYPVPGLNQAQRRFALDQARNAVRLEDHFQFAERGCAIDEVFVTWLPVMIDGTTAVLQGRRHHLRVTIADSPAASFILESLVDESQANDKANVLQRLRVQVEGDTTVTVRLQLDIILIGAAT